MTHFYWAHENKSVVEAWHKQCRKEQKEAREGNGEDGEDNDVEPMQQSVRFFDSITI